MTQALRALRYGSTGLRVAALMWSVAGLQVSQQHPGIEIHGTVINGIDGKAEPDVRVTLVRRTSTCQQILNEQALTDERGVFVLRAPSAGDYSISASRSSVAFGDFSGDPFTGS